MKTTRLFFRLVVLCVILALAAAWLPNARADSIVPPFTVWSDEFNGPELNSLWSWIREDDTHWSLTDHKGFLRITTQEGALLGPGGSAKNLLVQEPPDGTFMIATRVLYVPKDNFQIAGLLVYEDDDNFLMLGRAFCDDEIPNCVGNGIYFDHEEEGEYIGKNYATTIKSENDAYLAVIHHQGAYFGFVSDTGLRWKLVGMHKAEKGMLPKMVGLATDDSNTGAPEINADFDFFMIFDIDEDYDIFLLDGNPYRVRLPMVMN